MRPMWQQEGQHDYLGMNIELVSNNLDYPWVQGKDKQELIIPAHLKRPGFVKVVLLIAFILK